MARRLPEPLVRGIPGRAACLAGLCLLAGCSQQAVSTRLVVNTGEATDAQVAETAHILVKRFKDWLPFSINSKVNATVEGNRIRLEFFGDSPPVPDLVYLATTQGVYRIASSDAPGVIWISDFDLADVSCDMENDQINVNMLLTPAAGTRMLELTKRNVGKTAVSTLDGKLLTRAVIRGVFGQRFQTTFPADEHIRLTCSILKTGRLPVPIAGYEFEQSSANVNAHAGST